MTVSRPIGHDVPLGHLLDALAADRLHHALLLEGPHGVGKRTVARFLAMAANCTELGERPCGACVSCTRIAANNHPDVMWLVPDAEKATQVIPVAKVREVIRAAAYHRYVGRRRFILIDPAEALQGPAANSLLKTLEEPPPDTHFVLLTHRARTLLPTILSRCQRIRLLPVPLPELTAWLTTRGVPDAERAARASGGAPGLAVALSDGEAQDRITVRNGLLGGLAGDLQTVFDTSESLTRGERSEWSPRVELALETLEELLRDAVVAAAGSPVDRLHPDLVAVTDAWARALWPTGIDRCRRAIEDTRADLAVNVTAKTTMDALLARFATELGGARLVRG